MIALPQTHRPRHALRSPRAPRSTPRAIAGRAVGVVGHVGTAVTLASLLVVAASLGVPPGDAADERPVVTATLGR